METEAHAKVISLDAFFDRLKKRGMEGWAGAVWPVVVRRQTEPFSRFSNSYYQYQYPTAFFRNLVHEYKIYVPHKTKADRVNAVKSLLDKHMSGEIDHHMYHFGLFAIYGDRWWSFYMEEDFTEPTIGKRRYQHFLTLPTSEFKSNDDFISSIWARLIARREVEVGEYRRNPMFSEVRLLFTTDQFGNYTGRHYGNADWVEPVSGMLDLEVKRWVGEKDPMASAAKKEGMIEGEIVLGHEGGANGLRHFVQGEPIHAGTYMEVKFGDGWIAGRYEWNFSQGSPITICSNRDEQIYIREGHRVRVRG